MTTKQHRKQPSLGVKLHACLLLLGFTDEDIAAGRIRWDHYPALGLRPIRDGVMVPAPNDPHHLRPMLSADHDVKTFGRSRITSAGGDIHAIAKVKRLTGETPKRKSRPIQGRGFPKRKDR